MAYETIEVRIEADKVGVITLNRPKQLNALNDQLMNELGEALKRKFGLVHVDIVPGDPGSSSTTIGIAEAGTA